MNTPLPVTDFSHCDDALQVQIKAVTAAGSGKAMPRLDYDDDDNDWVIHVF